MLFFRMQRKCTAMYQALIDFFKNKRTLILGFGREGKATLAFLRKYYPDTHFTVADKNQVEIDDDNVDLIWGEHYLDCLNDFDIVMQSPGISLRDVTIGKNTVVTGEMDLFLRFVPCRKIGITGTKGKTTTTTLIYKMLCAADIPCMIMGNIGTPVFESLAEIEGKTAVIEMSCHQLEFAHASPDIAVLTNVYPEHLDHYNGFVGYVNAKLNIVRYQNENNLFISNADQPLGDIIGDESFIRARRKKVSKNEYKNDEFFASLVGHNEHLPGEQQWQDIFFAAAAVREYGVSDDAIRKAIDSFGGIEHRLDKFIVKNGIAFYDDAIATIPTAAIGNVRALGNVGTLIVGGLDRGLDYTQFVRDLAESGIDNLLCMPETGYAIADEKTQYRSPVHVEKCETLELAVERSFKLTKPGKSCLLSPAAASYNRYKNFEEKGNAFKRLVTEYDG
ncbi:MAG TPA: UDP-N-acetylmuramoyl-L-alanine--D-glutamate ligase [Ruminococcaceae bacterium]|nr:UDP-N-acetylmuramoyl-L-alanine--D-glutamate ligase [Oscillospiraceae bacterium]